MSRKTQTLHNMIDKDNILDVAYEAHSFSYF